MENKTLKTLKLNSCLINDEGARHLASAVQSDCNLERLSLADNCISEAGIGTGSSFLEGNRSITFLDLSANQVRPQTLTALQKACEANGFSDKHAGTERLRRELWRLEHVASKLPAVRLEKDRVQEIRKRNMAVMRDLKYSIQMAMSEGESNVETMKGKIQREGELAKDVLERIGEAAEELASSRSKFQDEKRSLMHKHKESLEKQEMLQQTLGSLQEEVKKARDLTHVETEEQNKVSQMEEELKRKEEQVHEIRKHIRLVKEYSSRQFDAESQASSVSNRSGNPSARTGGGKRAPNGKSGKTARKRVSGLMASLHT